MASIKRFLNQYKFELIFWAILIFSFALRFFNLGQIKELIFDEVYFVKDAQHYLTGTQFFDVHPPLGKLLMTLGILVFGDNPFGWRVMAALAGTGVVALFYFVAAKIFRDKKAALVAMFLAAAETMLLVYSRVGLIDIFVIFFVLLGLYFFVLFWQKKSLPMLFLSGLFLGSAASVKWVGVFGLILIFVLYLINQFSQFFQNKFQNLLPKLTKKHLLLFVFAFFLAYIIPFLIDFNLTGRSISYFLLWHGQALVYHSDLIATHPYSSSWWSWPLVLRPVWFLFDDLGNAKIQGIVALGNIFIWWASVPAIAFILYRFRKTKDLYLGVIGVGFLVSYVPFIFVSRIMFLYHFMPALIFGILAEAKICGDLWQNKKYRFLVGLFLAAVLIFFVLFLPLALGLPIPQKFFDFTIPFKSWI